jgi:hypothetical protein
VLAAHGHEVFVGPEIAFGYASLATLIYGDDVADNELDVGIVIAGNDAPIAIAFKNPAALAERNL